MLQVIQYQKTGEMFVEDLPAPGLKRGGILIQTVASLISAGTERTSVETAQASMIGKAKSRPDLVKQVLDNVKREGLMATYEKVQTRLDNYKELGYSSAGIVLESSVPEFKPGDRVACGGVGYASHAEMAFIPKNLATKIPDNVSFEEAAYTTVGAIAVQGVRQAEVHLGETVLVIGLGLIGLLTVQLLKANGCFVIGMDIRDTNFELAKKLGCDECIMNEPDAAFKVENFTHGVGTDAVIITASTNKSDPVEFAVEVGRKRSKIVAVGNVGLNVPRAGFYEKELDLRMSCSYGPGRYDAQYEEGGQDYPVGYVRWTENRNMNAFVNLISQGRVDVKALTTHGFDVKDALKAYDLITGKVQERYLGVLITYKNAETKAVSRKKQLGTAKSAPISGAVNVGFIGAGNFAQSNLIPPLLKTGAVLKGVNTSTPVNAQSVAKKYNFEYCATDTEHILSDKDINLVFIATRHDSHGRFVLEALKRGKKVFVEKPLCITEEELNEIADVFKKQQSEGKNPFLMVGYNRRFSQQFALVKDTFKGRTEPLVMNYRINAGFIPKKHWYQAESQRGRIIGEGCHFIDCMQYITGANPVSMYCAGTTDEENRYSSDNVNMTITFDDGSIGTISYLANGATNVDKEYLEVFGEGKTVVMNNFTSVDIYQNRKKTSKSFKLLKGHAEEVTVVVESVKAGKPSPIDFETLYATTLATIRAVESLATQQAKPIESF